MVKLILSAIGVLVLAAVSSQAFVLGAEAGRPYVRRLLAERALLLRFFLATFVVMPGLAIALAHSPSIPVPVWAGLILMSMMPPVTDLSKKAAKLGCDTEICLGWQTLAVVLSVVTIPLTLLLVERVFGVDLELGIGPVMRKIGSVYLIPMVAGFLARNFWPAGADALEKILKPIGGGAMALVLLLLLPLAVPLILKQGAAPILIILAFVAVSILVGHLMGGPPESLRPALVVTIAGRWIAPALVLSKENGWTQQLAPVLLTYVLGGALLMIVYQRWVKAHMAPAGGVIGGEPKLAGTPRRHA